jgi:hypothetical protein
MHYLIHISYCDVSVCRTKMVMEIGEKLHMDEWNHIFEGITGFVEICSTENCMQCTFGQIWAPFFRITEKIVPDFPRKKRRPVDPDRHTCVYLSKILAVVVGDSKKTTMPPSLDKLYNTISTWLHLGVLFPRGSPFQSLSSTRERAYHDTSPVTPQDQFQEPLVSSKIKNIRVYDSTNERFQHRIAISVLYKVHLLSDTALTFNSKS